MILFAVHCAEKRHEVIVNTEVYPLSRTTLIFRGV